MDLVNGVNAIETGSYKLTIGNLTSSDSSSISFPSTGFNPSKEIGVTFVAQTRLGYTFVPFTVSPSRNALNFDGNDDYYSLGIPTWTYSIQFRTSMTIECWFKTTDTNIQKSSGSFVTRWYNGGSGSDAQFMFGMNPSGNVYFHADGVVGVQSETTYKDALWHHAAVTFNSGEAILYIDGSVNATSGAVTSTSLLSSNSTLRLLVGNDDRGLLDRQFRGYIAEVRIWQVVRSAAEIRNKYLTQLNGNETGLLHYSKLNQGTANGNNSGVTTTENNMLSGGNVGTLFNFNLSGPTSNWVSGPNLSPAFS
jgi:hypothetical protein